MTKEELTAYPKEYFTEKKNISEVTGQPAHNRLQARRKPEYLGFPVSVCGTRTRIPKEPFINYWFGQGG